MSDHSVFPNSTYKDTVLAPLFEGAKSHFIPAVSAINRAHLVMLVKTKILSATEGAQICVALGEIEKDAGLKASEYTGEFEDYFFLVEAKLKEKLGPDLAGALHTARSRNDMDHTVFKMVLRERLDGLLQAGHDLLERAIEKADREKATLIVAYTHGQPAQPSTFGHYLGAMIEILLRDLKRLHDARDLLQKCPMGAAAITTSGFPIDRAMMADLLGFEAPLQNSYSCIAGVDYITGLYSAMKLVFLHLGRVVQDLQFWSSFEVGQLYVPNEFVQISSIMPQKRNPVPIEHLRLLSSLTLGRCDMMVNTMHNTPFTDMNDSEGEVQQAGYQAFESGSRVLALLSALVPALSINGDNVRANIDKSCITVTELADTLVRMEAISFRQAHEIASRVSKDVIKKEQTLAQGYDAFCTAFERSAGRAPQLDQAFYEKAVSAQNFVDVRNRFGGPASKPMDEALSGYRAELEALREKTQDFRQTTTRATKSLNKEFSRLSNSEGSA